MLIDSHAHLDFVDDIENVLKNAKNAGVGKIITVGTSINCSTNCFELSQKYSDTKLKIYPSCGLHPKDAEAEMKNEDSINNLVDKLKSLAQSKKFVAIGEAGLDYYLDSDKGQGTSEKEKNIQKELFGAQVQLASDLGLPLIVHCRNAWNDIFEILEQELSLTEYPQGQSSNLRGVFHSFTGNWEEAKKALEIGFYVSFSGIVTFKNAADILEVAKKIPLERILIETDSPYLAPEPVRGRKNEPQNVKIIADFISSVRFCPVEKIVNATYDNATKLFKLDD